MACSHALPVTLHTLALPTVIKETVVLHPVHVPCTLPLLQVALQAVTQIAVHMVTQAAVACSFCWRGRRR